MKTILFTILLLTLSLIVNAGSLYFPGASYVTQEKPLCNQVLLNGTLSLAGGNYQVQAVSSSGEYILLSMRFFINGHWYHEGDKFVVANGNPIPCTLVFDTPGNVLCGKTSTFYVNIMNVLGASAAKTEGYIKITNNLSIAGSVNFCGAATNTFTTNISSGSVNISKPGWKVNGQTPPVTISSTNFTVTSPIGDDKNVVLTFSSYCSCSSSSINLYANTANAPQPTILTYAAPIDCLYRLTTNNYNSTVYQYEWADNAAFNNATITSTNSTLGVGYNWELQPCESLTVYVRTRNGCSVSAPNIQSVTFPTMACCQMTGCCGYGSSPTPVTDEFLVSYSQSSDVLHIEYQGDEEFDGGIVQIHSIQGELLETIKFEFKIVDLPANKVQKGINLVRIVYNNKYYSSKIIKG